MHTPTNVRFILAASLVAALAGCGDGTSTTPSTGEHYTPSVGTFAQIAKPSSDGAVAVNTCNLDAVDDKPAGSEPLRRGASATFAGWAADGASNSVPAGVQLVLEGAQDYAVNASTGAPRPDVAKASNRPAWSTAGYSVKADLSAVAPGTYTPVLDFSAGGKHQRCPTHHQLVVE